MIRKRFKFSEACHLMAVNLLSGLRLLGIGRNQYIDLMNQCRSSKVGCFLEYPFIIQKVLNTVALKGHRLSSIYPECGHIHVLPFMGSSFASKAWAEKSVGLQGTSFIKQNCVYIDLLCLYLCMQKFFRKKPVKDLLPAKPVVLKVLEPWWKVQIGFITEDDIRVC